MDDLDAYRCVHGYLFLGCPHDNCEEQNRYLESQNAVMDAWNQRQRDEARALVRGMLGLPSEV